MMPGPFHPRFEDLPTVLPVFPLQGAMVLPWGKLPLNIFEPRYLAMIQDALGAGRMIGMIQPRRRTAEVGTGDPPNRPLPLYDVGCLGRLTNFAETEDGRFLITLTGVLRFRIAEEPPGRRGYRVVVPDYAPFRADLDPPPAEEIPRHRLMTAMAGYVTREELPLNVKVFEDLKEPELVTTLCMLCPFEVSEKQALLEAPTLGERARMLLALLEMASFAATAGDPGTRQ
jgi:Lon protease-like protein